MIVFAAIMPHPPTSMPGVGTSEDSKLLAKTLQSFDELRKGLEDADPDTIVVISPHAHLEEYAFVINSASELKGSMEKFGNDEVYVYKNNIEIADKLAFTSSMNEMPAHLHEDFMDHGTLVPLYHLTKNIKPKIVQLSFSLMSYQSHYRYGEIIQKVINNGNPTRIAVIASGDLSHRLTVNSPAGYSKSAQEFDHTVLRLLGSNDLASIMGMDQEITQEVAECGMRSIVVLLGILHGKPYKFDLLSYEGPYGIGHLTARML